MGAAFEAQFSALLSAERAGQWRWVVRFLTRLPAGVLPETYRDFGPEEGSRRGRQCGRGRA